MAHVWLFAAPSEDCDGFHPEEGSRVSEFFTVGERVLELLVGTDLFEGKLFDYETLPALLLEFTLRLKRAHSDDRDPDETLDSFDLRSIVLFLTDLFRRDDWIRGVWLWRGFEKEDLRCSW